MERLNRDQRVAKETKEYLQRCNEAEEAWIRGDASGFDDDKFWGENGFRAIPFIMSCHERNGIELGGRIVSLMEENDRLRKQLDERNDDEWKREQMQDDRLIEVLQELRQNL